MTTSTADPLTGLPTWATIRPLVAHPGPVTFGILDVDNLGGQSGWTAGDDALAAIGRALAAAAWPLTAGRIGGDEFAVAGLRRIDGANADAIRRNAAAGGFTLSAGFVIGLGGDVDLFRAAAAVALREAKAKGGNCTVFRELADA